MASDPWLRRVPHQHPLRGWLTDPASLTARLRQRCVEFRVDVLFEGWRPALPDEARLIDCQILQPAWTREVLLSCDGQITVFAHSVVSRSALAKGWQLLRGVGSRPLGGLLFSHPQVQRGPLQQALLSPHHPLARRAHRAIPHTAAPYWARRSRFCLDGQPLLVSEVFLPAIEELAP